MNSRKKRFWKVWYERLKALADVDVKKANKRIDDKIHKL